MKKIQKILFLGTLFLSMSSIKNNDNNNILDVINSNENIQLSETSILKANSNNLLGLGKVKTTGGNLNVRKSPSFSSTIINKLKNNSFVEIFDETNSWYYIQFDDGSYGYSYKDYISLDKSCIRYVNTESLNIRSGPSTSYKKLGILSKGEKVGVISTSSSWSNIIYDGTKIGYVHNSYLKTSSSDKYKSISLKVTNYKQFDSRWASKKLGSSSATFKASGCAVTALSMMESFRSKVDINPYDYSKKLKFTSSGALYWPTTYYSISSSSASYLNRIYENLLINKPVMIGLKNSSGKQHYVVVTGFIGGDSLSSSKFIINDPGSSTRTKLSEVLSIRPYFYKLITIK